MKEKIVICDDDEMSIEAIRNMLLQYQFMNNLNLEIETFSDPESLLNSYKAGYCSILLLDVEMPGYDGIEIARKIRSIPDKNVIIIYISNYPQYMSNAFDVRAFHYIQKASFNHAQINQMQKQLFHVLDQAMKDLSDTSQLIKIQSASGNEYLYRISEISSISSVKNRGCSLQIVHAGQVDTGFGRIQYLADELKPYHFVYASRWCIVNLNHIHAITKDGLFMDDGSRIPLSRHYKDELEKQFSHNVMHLV